MKDQTEYADPLVRFVMHMLKVAADHPALIPEGFEDALYACQKIVIPETRAWFQAELTNILKDEEDKNLPFEKRRWRDLPRGEILAGAARQLPGHKNEYRDMWQRAMKSPTFATYALTAMAENPIQIIDHLGEWWDVNPPGRELHLKRFLALLVRTSKPRPLLHRLRLFGGAWSRELRMAVAEICNDAGFPYRPFPTRKPRLQLIKS